MAEEKKTGRPAAFDDPVEFEKKVDEYFDWCDAQTQIITGEKGQIKVIRKPYTVSGLALFLDVDRKTLFNYEDKEAFFPAIKKAKLRIENWLEERALTGEVQPISAIFNLKNNFGWTDKQELGITGETTLHADISGITADELKKLAREE